MAHREIVNSARDFRTAFRRMRPATLFDLPERRGPGRISRRHNDMRSTLATLKRVLLMAGNGTGPVAERFFERLSTWCKWPRRGAARAGPQRRGNVESGLQVNGDGIGIPHRGVRCSGDRPREKGVGGAKKGSGAVAGTAQRVLRTTAPDPFFFPTPFFFPRASSRAP